MDLPKNKLSLYMLQFCLIVHPYQITNVLLRINIIIFLSFTCRKRIIETIRIVNKCRPDFCRILYYRILLQQTKLFRQLIIRLLLCADKAAYQQGNHRTCIFEEGVFHKSYLLSYLLRLMSPQ